MRFVGSIPVKDANGVELTLYEFQGRRFFKKVRRWQLCTGETVERVGRDLVVVRTGETLVRP